MLLRRAADALEAFYVVPRTQQHMAQPNHGCFPGYYPRSPAIFTPLFTPQFKSPGFPLISPSKGMFGGDMEHKEEGSSGNYPSNPVSRCNSNEALAQQPQQQQTVGGGGNMDGAFVFPQIPSHDAANQIPLSSIQKPKPIPPSPMAAPMYPMAAMPYLHYAHHIQQHPAAVGFPKVEPGTVHPHYLHHTGGDEGGNRNNNNSAHQGGSNSGAGAGGLPHHMGGQQPVSFGHHVVPGSSSHGYIMTGPHSGELDNSFVVCIYLPVLKSDPLQCVSGIFKLQLVLLPQNYLLLDPIGPISFSFTQCLLVLLQLPHQVHKPSPSVQVS